MYLFLIHLNFFEIYEMFYGEGSELHARLLASGSLWGGGVNPLVQLSILTSLVMLS